MRTKGGSFKIFTLAGIGVYVHWMWFLAALYSIQYRTHVYSSLIWNVFEYLSLFGIVLAHEFGHQLACRSVGGKTHDIILWLLGGVAYVSPPQRPGAQLWSIAAGPLVNVVLIPVLSVLVSVSSHLGWYDTNPNAYELIHNVWRINIGLLIFNMMPVYPLDGGQILRSLLWFPFGRANSLLAASIIGFIGLAGLVLLALLMFFFFWRPVVGHLAGIDGCFHRHELLGRSQARASPGEDRQAVAPRGFQMSVLPNGSAAGRTLALRPMSSGIRHLSHAGGLPTLRNAIHRDTMSRLRNLATVQRMEFVAELILIFRLERA
jgi:Zn-dependent protease